MSTITTDTGEQICGRHDQPWSALSPCPDCIADPQELSADVEVESVAAPEGCMTTIEIELEFVRQADEIQSWINKLSGKVKRRGVKSGADSESAPVLDTHAYNTLAKLCDAKVKVMRQAFTCAARREDLAITERRHRERIDLERGVAH